MPLYEYQCDACGRRFERIQKFSDPPVDTCPTCGGTVHKLISSPAFQFKGTGWYVSDYARKDKGRESAEGGKAEAGSNAADKPAEGKDTGSSTESKATGESKGSAGESTASKDPKESKPPKAPTTPKT